MIIRYIIQNIFKCSNIMPFEFYTKRAGVRRSSPASNWCRRTDNKGVFFLNKPISQIHKLETIADSLYKYKSGYTWFTRWLGDRLAKEEWRLLAIFVNQPCFPLLSIVGDIKDHFQDPLLRRMRGCLPKTRSKPASILSSSPPHPPLLISSSPLFVPKSFLPAINYFPAAITNLEFKAGRLIFLPIRDVC